MSKEIFNVNIVLYTETSSHRTFKIMPRNLKDVHEFGFSTPIVSNPEIKGAGRDKNNQGYDIQYLEPNNWSRQVSLVKKYFNAVEDSVYTGMFF